MNTKLNVAVAAALFAAATGAQAGIVIPAGDWTLDIGGVVNAYYTNTKFGGDGAAGTAALGLGDGNGSSQSNITTGLLPNYLSVSGKTRQNDLDVGFTISINPGSSSTNSGIQRDSDGGGRNENRQAFLTFGDASWGSVKVGKDLGIFASDAILNDMTLLGVGAGAGSLAGNTTTLGRIGAGYIYADWKSQIAYTSPNWNGFQFTAGITQGWNATNTGIPTAALGATSTDRAGAGTGYEGKASYEWTGDVAGKVWASAISQNISGVTGAGGKERAYAWDLGTTVNLAGFGLTGYYYNGKGIGQTFQYAGGLDAAGNRRDSDGYYVQGTYTLPGVGTKLGLSYGKSKLEGNSADVALDEIKDSLWTVGAYHPLTKHLNLVAEFSKSEREYDNRATTAEANAKTVSLGAILFF
ncbi:MAG: porin [Methylophilus sp.]|uniref:porin n=1 Tax=Methylophilus sp. TaxID=29541 RepID=UPI003FA17360